MLLRDHVFVFSMFGIIVSILKLNSIFSVKIMIFVQSPLTHAEKTHYFPIISYILSTYQCVSRVNYSHNRNEITAQQRTRRETKSHHPRITFFGSFGTVSIIQSHCLRPLKVKNVTFGTFQNEIYIAVIFENHEKSSKFTQILLKINKNTHIMMNQSPCGHRVILFSKKPCVFQNHYLQVQYAHSIGLKH